MQLGVKGALVVWPVLNRCNGIELPSDARRFNAAYTAGDTCVSSKLCLG